MFALISRWCFTYRKAYTNRRHTSTRAFAVCCELSKSFNVEVSSRWHDCSHPLRLALSAEVRCSIAACACFAETASGLSVAP